MTITLKLPEELEKRLKAMADLRGISMEESALELLEKNLSDQARREKAIALLQSLRDAEDDDQEQKETGEFLIRALDEDRPSDRKLFPPELKGITW